MLLFDKSIRRNRLKLANDLGGISVMKFCSKRLNNLKKKLTERKEKNRKILTIQLYLRVMQSAQLLDSFHDNLQFHQHIDMDVDTPLLLHIRLVHFQSNLEHENFMSYTKRVIYELFDSICRNTIIRHLYCNFLLYSILSCTQ